MNIKRWEGSQDRLWIFLERKYELPIVPRKHALPKFLVSMREDTRQTSAGNVVSQVRLIFSQGFTLRFRTAHYHFAECEFSPAKDSFPALLRLTFLHEQVAQDIVQITSVGALAAVGLPVTFLENYNYPPSCRNRSVHLDYQWMLPPNDHQLLLKLPKGISENGEQDDDGMVVPAGTVDIW